METSNPRNEQTPMVSVVTIAYNNADYIERAIRGVVKQISRFPIELIISDDASTDDTPRIIENWRRNYPDIIRYYRNEKNLGLQRNYLEAFKHCRGRYLAMCDADDYWFFSSKLHRQVEYMEQHPECALTFHRIVNWYEGTRVKSLSNGGQVSDPTVSDLARGNFITNMSVMYRRELVDLHNLPEWLQEISLLDYGMHMLYASKGDIHYFRRPMGVYRQSPAGTWSQAGEFKRLDMAFQVRLRLLRHFHGDSRIVPNMSLATLNILAAMWRYAGKSQQMQDEVRNRLLEVSPFLDEPVSLSRIIELASEPSPSTRPGLVKRIARSSRIFLSRMISLPQP